MYVLHYAPDNASLVIRLALLERGLPFETRIVDRSRHAQREPAYLALNPTGTIPVLETPEGPLSETAAILLWLADRHGGLGPGPTDPGRGAFLRWLLFTSNTLHAELRLVFAPQAFAGPDPAAQQALHAGVTARLRDHLALLDRHAARGTEGFAGPAPNALDLYLAVILRWCALYDPLRAPRGSAWFAPGAVPALMALARRIEDRPAARAATAAEGLGPRPFSAPSPCRPPEGSPT